jgi:hypothetical protein
VLEGTEGFRSGPFKEDGLKLLLSYDTGRIVLPAAGVPPSDRVVSRFLGKAGLEALASRLVKYPEGLEYLVTEPQLDPVRDHAPEGDAARLALSRSTNLRCQ